MKRLAIVVQRCHTQIAGGSEALAWHYAQLLRGQYEVEILTSCALDYRSWDNALPEGAEQRDGVTIRRYATAWPRGSWFNELHRRLLHDYARDVERGGAAALSWRAPLAEQFIRAQGPWCPGLIEHLHQHHSDYAAVLFCTYLYPTSYFGLECVPAAKRLLIPTLHDEPPAYLPVYAQAARTARLLWLTEAERRLGARLWKVQHGDIIGMAVDTTQAAPAAHEKPYLLYCGRIDESKGCRELLEGFRQLRRQRLDPVELVLTGADHLHLREADGVRYLGFVAEARKHALMAGARAFVMPSRWESFSIVTLEALAQGTPVIVNGDCDVLADHADQSRAGWRFHDQASLLRCMHQALDLPGPERAALADNARSYVAQRYARQTIAAKLVACVEAVANAAGRDEAKRNPR